MYGFLSMKSKKGFTLIEIIAAVALLLILSAIVIIAINPARNFAESRNTQRSSNVNAILNAIGHYAVDNKSQLPNGIDTNLRMIGTSTTGCNVACGEHLPISGSINEGGYSSNSGLFTKAYASNLVNENYIPANFGPQIISANVNPQKVTPGDSVKITAKIKDPKGVSEVVANMGGIETIKLELQSSDSKDGIWQATWKAHDTETKVYISEIKATNFDNFSSTFNVQWSDPVASGWVSPDTVQTPTGQWANPSNTIDGNTVTYATNTFGGTGWGEFIYFNLNESISTNRIRMVADYQTAQISQVQIDVFKDGVWTNVFLGGDEATWDAKWAEVSFPTLQTSQARFRYNYSAGGFQYWVYEFQFYKTVPVITAPIVFTQSADLIQDVYANIHGLVIDDGGEPCDYRFEYGLTTSYDLATSWLSGGASGVYLDAFINALQPATIYHFRFVARNSVATTNGMDQTFTTLNPVLGYIAPVSFIDPDNVWNNESNAIDNNTATYASSYHAINSDQWSSYIYLTQGDVFSNGLSFNARGQTEVDQAQVDIFVNGGWITVFNGGFTNRVNTIASFSQSIVTQARIRFHATAANNGFYWQLYEFTYKKSSDGTNSACIDLSGLSPDYIVGIPFDPSNGSNAATYYAVKKAPNNDRLLLYACTPELNVDIVVAR